MSLAIHKKGQGTVARWVAYLLAGLLLAFGAIRLYASINRPGEHVWVAGVPIVGDVTLYKAIAAFVFFMGAYGIHVLLNRPASTDLLIDTEQELKKVSWPSGREVYNATLVVVLVTFVVAFLLFGFDEILQRVFRLFF